MGTLTGCATPLPAHCTHKLPTSCRLSSPVCCACLDRRPHQAFYSTYVDGVGLVNRGKRWQRYCWFCSEFWQRRVAAASPPIDPCETKVPEVPDQSEFIHTWFDYHGGRRQCEVPWRDVDPGQLPIRSGDEVRATGRRRQQPPRNVEHVDLDVTLDSLIAESAENDEQPSRQTAQELETQRLEALRDAQHRLQIAVTDLREAKLTQMRIRRELRAADRAVERSAERRDVANEQLQARRQELPAQLANPSPQERTRNNLVRIFGTAEHVQDPEYVSPLTSIFGRANERYRIAEEVRGAMHAHADQQQRYHDLMQQIASEHYWYTSLRGDTDVSRFPPHQPMQEPPKTLDDADDNRPPPLGEEEMMVKLMCKVCLQQQADTAFLPCGHLVTCNWCAAICCPSKEDGTASKRSVCPLCRKQVRRITKIYLS